MMLISGLEPDPRLERVTMVPDLAKHNEDKANSLKVGDKKELYRKHAHQFSNEFYSLEKSIRRDGVNVPLMIWRNADKKWLIADGRHRWMAAKEAGVKEVPVIFITAEKALDVILASENRRHFTKGALAYRAVLLCPEVATEAKEIQKLGALGPKDPRLNQGELSTRISVGIKTMKDACALYRAYIDHPILRKRHEQTVWTCANIRKLKGEMLKQIEHFEDHGTYLPKKEPKLTDEEKREKFINTQRAEVNFGMRWRREKAAELEERWYSLTAEDKEVMVEHVKEELNLLPTEFLITYAKLLSEKLNGEEDKG